jgi:hypothetical protein
MFSHCFCGCWSLSTVIFETGSQLSAVHGSLFSGCSSLTTIVVPASLATILSDYAGLLKVVGGGVVDRERRTGAGRGGGAR